MGGMQDKKASAADQPSNLMNLKNVKKTQSGFDFQITPPETSCHPEVLRGISKSIDSQDPSENLGMTSWAMRAKHGGAVPHHIGSFSTV